MNYSCESCKDLFVLEGCERRVRHGDGNISSGFHSPSCPFFACGGARDDDLFRLTGLMAPNAFPKGLRSNVVDFYWLS